jgi:hypothetical protein
VPRLAGLGDPGDPKELLGRGLERAPVVGGEVGEHAIALAPLALELVRPGRVRGRRDAEELEPLKRLLHRDVRLVGVEDRQVRRFKGPVELEALVAVLRVPA